MTKKYIDAQQLLDDSYNLGLKVLDSGCRPDYIIGVWRGGTPVGIAVQELLDFFGIKTDHISIRTSSYTGIEQRVSNVRVHGLDYIIKNVNAEDTLLIVDDVYDSGLSVAQIIEDLTKKCRRNTPIIKIATPYYKPQNNKTDRVPDFYLYETDEWLVFPHELTGLTKEELLNDKPGLEVLKERIRQMD
ncbi:MAG: hypoxanthine phosphoribosyltransferase [Gammaproteobacteria bacterium]|nr:hypoxanthine phosphoribosyltransferase [Gammaproteobacteria bacterium]